MMVQDDKCFIYNSNKKLLEIISPNYDFLYFAKKYKYPEHISALLDENISDEDYKQMYSDAYKSIMSINQYRVAKGDEHRKTPRTHMEFARDIASNFIIEDIFIELFNKAGGNCKINDGDKDRDIKPSGSVDHMQDFIFNINGHQIGVEFKMKYKDTKTFSFYERQLPEYSKGSGLMLIIKPFQNMYSVINVNKIQLLKSDFKKDSFYCRPTFKKFSFSADCFKQIINDIITLSSIN